ncbi:hypothetical protein BT96DRAFT_945611 [Gymnopus androsaceus JB14]|uniref:Uncharacterized protein n=1 Tax=Gymnopus androsaceus JB14 TaxID=1447944 RepID=A0A6A4H0J5_9AGAR|nr:hypothetical protein BT96DRAFT_945611 [Gymnopus androsaceus JB14]
MDLYRGAVKYGLYLVGFSPEDPYWSSAGRGSPGIKKPLRIGAQPAHPGPPGRTATNLSNRKGVRTGWPSHFGHFPSPFYQEDKTLVEQVIIAIGLWERRMQVLPSFVEALANGFGMGCIVFLYGPVGSDNGKMDVTRLYADMDPVGFEDFQQRLMKFSEQRFPPEFGEARSAAYSAQRAGTSTSASTSTSTVASTSTPLEAASTSTPAASTSTVAASTSTPLEAASTSTAAALTSTPAAPTSTPAASTSTVAASTSTPLDSTAAALTSTPAAPTITPAASTSTVAASTSTPLEAAFD